MDTPISGVDTWLILNGKPLSFQSGNENESADAAESRNNLIRITPNAPDGLQIRVENELLETERYGRWYWRPKDYAGLYQLEVLAPDHPPFLAKIRVRPGKLSAQRYVSMLVDITQFATDLLFGLHSPAGVKVIAHTRDREQSALREFQLVQHIIHELGLIMARIRRNPRRSLQGFTEPRLIHEIHYFSSEVSPVPGPTVALDTLKTVQYLPIIWTVQQHELTYDVYENRLLKHFIQYQLASKIRHIQKSIDREKKLHLQNRELKRIKGWEDDETPKIKALEEKWNESQNWLRKCIDWVGEPFLIKIKIMFTVDRASQFLLKNPDYSRFYRLYLQFQRELKLNVDTDDFFSTLAPRKMSELYEIWSILQLTSLIIDVLIQEEYTFASSSLFYELEKDRFQFDIKKNTSSIILRKDDRSVEIKYEPLYRKNISGSAGLVSHYTDQVTPDMAIEVYVSGTIEHVIVFDAKYKYLEQDGEYFPKEEDIGKMSWYRDAIRYWEKNPQRPNKQARRIVSSAYIIYPGTSLQHFQEEPEVGALPLIPDMKADMWVNIEEAVKDILWFADLLH